MTFIIDGYVIGIILLFLGIGAFLALFVGFISAGSHCPNILEDIQQTQTELSLFTNETQLQDKLQELKQEYSKECID